MDQGDERAGTRTSTTETRRPGRRTRPADTHADTPASRIERLRLMAIVGLIAVVALGWPEASWKMTTSPSIPMTAACMVRPCTSVQLRMTGAGAWAERSQGTSSDTAAASASPVVAWRRGRMGTMYHAREPHVNLHRREDDPEQGHGQDSACSGK